MKPGSRLPVVHHRAASARHAPFAARRTVVAWLAVSLIPLAGCSPTYSPDTYSAAAVQQANKVEQGVIVGVRQVGITAQGVIGTASGAAAGGIVGSQAAPGVGSALGALGGSLVGGLVGSAVEHSTADTAATEYVVRKGNGELVSVTQKDEKPLELGQKVLVISGPQARIVPDYTVPIEAGGKPGVAAGPAAAAAAAAAAAEPPGAGHASSAVGDTAAVPPPVPVTSEPLPAAGPLPALP